MVSLRGESVTTVMSVPRPLFFLPASSCAEWRSRKYAQDMEYTLDKNGRLFRVIFLSACKEKRWDFLSGVLPRNGGKVSVRIPHASQWEKTKLCARVSLLVSGRT